MQPVQINLQPYNQTFILSRDAISQYLPQSLLAQALEEDPNATTIDIPNPIVTPEAMQTISDYTYGIEPDVANPELALVSRYLNIPELRYYADPLYNQIRRPVHRHIFTKWRDLTPDELADTNWPVLIEALNEGSPMAEYLRQKGMDLGGAIIYARDRDLSGNAHAIIDLMVEPYNVSEEIIYAASTNNIDDIERLLPENAPQSSVDAVALIAAYDNSMGVLGYILSHFTFLSPQIRHAIGRALVVWSRLRPQDFRFLIVSREYLEWLIENRYV